MGRTEIVAHPIEEANEDSIFGGATAEEFYERHGVRHEEAWMRNGRGMRIYTQWWEPIRGDEGSQAETPPKKTKTLRGVILALHGYTGDSSWTVQLTCIGLASRGFAVYALDHAGHGKSDGLRAHIPDVDPLLEDCLLFYSKTIAPRHAQLGAGGLPLFLYGESLGGALALLLHLRQPYAEALRPEGVILSGAMCGVSKKFQPPWPLPLLLRLLAWLFPTAPIVPTRGSIPHRSFREPWKLRLSLVNPRRVFLRPRPATALLILRLAEYLQSHLHQVTIPFLIVHGELDVICDPEGVIALYEKASSHDKTLKIYDGMWHQLVGEPKEDLDVVFTDICSWLEERAPHLSDD